MSTPPVIVVVGAGFAGVVTTIELLRCGLPPGTRIVLIERPGHGIGGLAYDVTSERLLLNLRAERMSAFADAPLDFAEFLAAAQPGSDGASFAPRQLYGRYLAARLDAAAFRSAAAAVLEPTAAEVTDVRARGDGRWDVIADAGVRHLSIAADAVLLATGASAPLEPRWLEPWMREQGRFHDAWSAGFAPPREPGAVVAVGSGLTFVDLLVELRAGGYSGPVVAISRHGRLPQPEGPAAALPEPGDLPPAVAAERPLSTRRLLRELAEHAATLAARGRDYRAMLAALRPHSLRLWTSLGMAEQARFLRHARALWDVHRHRMPEISARMIAAEFGRGTLTVLAGRVLGVGRSARGLTLSVQRRGAREAELLEAGLIVNCTGAPAGAPLDNPWPGLLERGSACRDALGLGVLTDAAGRLIGRDGSIAPGLYYAGPLWRAREWEITAVPELRARLPALAREIAAGVVRARVLA